MLLAFLGDRRVGGFEGVATSAFRRADVAEVLRIVPEVFLAFTEVRDTRFFVVLGIRMFLSK